MKEGEERGNRGRKIEVERGNEGISDEVRGYERRGKEEEMRSNEEKWR